MIQKLKKVIASVAVAALLPSIPVLTNTSPVAQAATKTVAVSITGAAMIRSTDESFLEPKTGTNGISLKSAADQIQIFSNRSDVGNGSQCGAYYQYEIPECEGVNEAVTLTLVNAYTSTDTLHVISVGIDNAGVAGSETFTAENVFKDVSAAYTATEKTVIDIPAPVSDIYTVDITDLSKQGTNAVFVYTDDNTNDTTPRHDVKNASISMTYDAVVWKASEASWSLSNDKINGYANINADGSLTTTMVADSETNNYDSDTSVKTAYDNASFKGTINAGNDNIMGMVATAGSSTDYPFKADTTYTLHYTLLGDWKNAVTNTPNGAYLNYSVWTDASKRIENKTNNNITSTSAGVPISKTYEFTPSVDCYAQFNFLLRRVNAGDTMTVSDIYVTTEEEVYTVTFNSNGGSTVASQMVFENEYATEPTAPTREACTFGGWYSDSDFTTAYDFTTPVTGDTTLYAKWVSVTGDTLTERKIDLTDAKIYRFPLISSSKKYEFADDVTSDSTYNAVIDGVYTKDAEIPRNNYVMLDLGKEYTISTIKAYQNDLTTAGAGGNFVAVLPGSNGTETEPFVKADLKDLIRTNSAYSTQTTENGTNCFTYSLLSSEKHNMGSHRYIILHNGGSYTLNIAEIEVYEDTTEKNAYLSLRNFYSDHMVLQRNKPHIIKGYSSTGTSVSVTMTEDSNPSNTQTVTAVPSSDGNWTASIPAMKAGLSPYTITVADDTEASAVTLTDVLVGDVFLASGQSNMAYEAPKTASESDNVNEPGDYGYYRKGIFEKQNELADENIRMFKIRDDNKAESGLVTENVPVWVDWCKSDGTMLETKSDLSTTSVTHTNVLALSTLAAFFAHNRIQAEEGIPVGIIQSSRGGSAINIWSEGGRLYNNHIAPLEGLNIAGILWYQGCANSNATGFKTYYDDFKALIKEYRRVFNDSELPFMYVQLAPYKNAYAEYEQAGSQRFQVMREIQRCMLDDSEVNTNLYMAVSLDTTENSHHNADGSIARTSLIHPLGKDTLAKRMADAYAEMKNNTGAVVDGPMVSGATADGDVVTVTFKAGTANGLKVLNPDYTYQHMGELGWRSDTTELDEFKLAGADGVYYDAKAVIDGDTVKVTSASVSEPIYVSYAYSELPKNPNLANSANLPASPFNIGIDGASAPIAPPLDVEFEAEKQSFTNENSDEVDAYIFTAILNSAVTVKIGAANGEKTVYVGNEGEGTAITGANLVYFAAIAPKDRPITPIYSSVE